MIPHEPAAAVARSALDDVQLARRLVEHDRPVLATDDDVLDAGTVLAREIDARLHAEGHAGPQGQIVAGNQVRILMPFEADPVPGSMEERLAVALGLDPGARRNVH